MEPTEDQMLSGAPLRRDEWWRLYEISLARRNAQDSILWTFFGIFSAAAALLLAAVFDGGGIAPPPVVALLSLFGILTGAVWHMIQRRANHYVREFGRIADECASRLGIPENLLPKRKRGTSAGVVIAWVPPAWMGVWLVAGAISLYRLVP